MDFKLHAPYQPTGDQPQAIDALARGLELGFDEQVMLGVTRFAIAIESCEENTQFVVVDDYGADCTRCKVRLI